MTDRLSQVSFILANLYGSNAQKIKGPCFLVGVGEHKKTLGQVCDTFSRRQKCRSNTISINMSVVDSISILLRQKMDISHSDCFFIYRETSTAQSI